MGPWRAQAPAAAAATPPALQPCRCRHACVAPPFSSHHVMRGALENVGMWLQGPDAGDPCSPPAPPPRQRAPRDLDFYALLACLKHNSDTHKHAMLLARVGWAPPGWGRAGSECATCGRAKRELWRTAACKPNVTTGARTRVRRDCCSLWVHRRPPVRRPPAPSLCRPHSPTNQPLL